MRANKIIRLFITGILTVIFVFSTVPKIVLHDVFADHHYKSFYHIPDEHPHFDPPSASCDCVCQWFDQQYDQMIIPDFQPVTSQPSAHFSEKILRQYKASIQHTVLRGPPVCISAYI